MIRVRVRGIVSTAIAKILIGKGYRIVQASDIIRERFGLENDNSPADVTVKDSGEADSILVIGFYREAKEIYEYISSELEYVFQWKAPIGLYSIIRGIVIEKEGYECIVDLGGIKGVLRECRNNVGDNVVVSVIKAPVKPGETAILSYDLKLVGEYVTITYGSKKLTISENIRNPLKRGELASIGLAKGFSLGVGIHFRSSSQFAPREAIEKEIDELSSKLKEIYHKSRDLSESFKTIYDGEFIGLISLTSIAKEKLDYYRSLVTPTVRNHHSYKLSSRTLSELVDQCEDMVRKGSCTIRDAEENIVKTIIDKTQSTGAIDLIHVKPSGEVCRLTPGEIHYLTRNQDGFEVVIKRIMMSDGVYDGLGIEKKAGDIDYVYLKSNEWFLSHNYFRNESWLGSYININTPVEISIGAIKYHDLVIDIIVRNNGEVELRDMNEFEKYCREGVIRSKLCEDAYSVAMRIKNEISRYIYKPSSRGDAGVPEIGQRGRAQNPVA